MSRKAAILLWIAAGSAIMSSALENTMIGMEMCAQFSGQVQVPHPTNCNQFFVCTTDGMGHLMDCPAGHYFDMLFMMCNLQEGAICWADLATPPTIGPGGTTTTPGPTMPGEEPTTTAAPGPDIPEAPTETTLPPSAPTETPGPGPAPATTPGIPEAPTPTPTVPTAPTPTPAVTTTTAAPTPAPTTTTAAPTAPTPPPATTRPPVTTPPPPPPPTTTLPPVTTPPPPPPPTTTLPPVTPPPPPPPPTPTPSPGGPTINCPLDGYFYAPHPDCTRFYRCVFGTLHVLTCPPNQYWNQAREYCDHIWNVNCTPSPQG